MQTDRHAIEELHLRDQAAAIAGDFAALRELIDDDAVLMPPGARKQRGKAEIDASFARRAAASRTHDILEYTLDFEEVRILGDLAVEWGTICGSMREIASGRMLASAYHVMRILKRQPSGDWKVYRSIWSPAERPTER